MDAFIPYGRQSIGAADELAVLDVLRSPFLTQGPAVDAFEENLAAYVGAQYCVTVCNATAGLHLAIAALELGEGEAITTPITFVATANAMAYCGLAPRFSDIDRDTRNLSPEMLEQAISPETRLVLPVHFAGVPADMAGIAERAARRQLAVIEDAAHAIGSKYPTGEMVGSCAYSDLTVFSFHPVKTMTTGEGGAITTNDRDLYEKILLLRSHGTTRDPGRLQQTPGPWWYEQHELGFNYRLTDIQAALGSSQLARLPDFIARRRALVRRYMEALADLPYLTLPHYERLDDYALHLFAVEFDFEALGMSRAAVMAALKAEGVGSQVHYIPVYRQPWHRKALDGDIFLGNAEAYYERCLSLPLFPDMTDHDLARVVAAVRGLGAAGSAI